MLKYLYSQIVTKEVPDEISLAFSITGCPVHCRDCHSPHTWDKEIGKELSIDELIFKLKENKYVSCILFYGGEWEFDYLVTLLSLCRDLGYKTALYSGCTIEWFELKYPDYCKYLDYIKVGRYDSVYGSLDYPSTNQRMYRIHDDYLEDITNKFWRLNVR